MMPMRLTIIVPVRNEAACIESTLRALLNQEYPPSCFEVLVIDGCSEDETVAIVRRLQGEFNNLRLFYNPKRWSSAARNIGIRHMTGDAAIIVDGHTHLNTPHYLSCVADAFETSGAPTLGRPQPLRLPKPTRFQKALGLARASKLGHNPDSAIYSDQAQWVRPQNVAIAYRREVFEKVGLFDERFDACEDVEFNTRVDAAGLTCWFDPRLRIDYHPRSTLGGLMKQMGRYGRGRARLAKKHPCSITVPSLLPTAWLVWLIIAPLTALVLPEIGLLLLATLALYASAVLGEAIRMAKQEPTACLHIPYLIPAIHVGFGWGYLHELIRR